MAPGKEEWTFVNHNGRLPIPLAERLKEKEGKRSILLNEIQDPISRGDLLFRYRHVPG
jgi:hypothetical protein